jgi:hypothetical protein
MKEPMEFTISAAMGWRAINKVMGAEAYLSDTACGDTS